ncbi:unnamed protein product [Bursaphelenchus okinawaensis]|uniref:Expansin-like EG45 domain-containing protein n=1 Tax=Bursaphelenchus okinawaensis TaxID=465554 RepID=A0A811KCR2_9BILA|nr:unnamed protein product [Bursaphelenchus okinawaensis]CAG9099158.1 unnamed protein product [Bursaphelenchus okinawaensis]
MFYADAVAGYTNPEVYGQQRYGNGTACPTNVPSVYGTRPPLQYGINAPTPIQPLPGMNYAPGNGKPLLPPPESNGACGYGNPILPPPGLNGPSSHGNPFLTRPALNCEHCYGKPLQPPPGFNDQARYGNPVLVPSRINVPHGYDSRIPPNHFPEPNGMSTNGCGFENKCRVGLENDRFNLLFGDESHFQALCKKDRYKLYQNQVELIKCVYKKAQSSLKGGAYKTLPDHVFHEIFFNLKMISREGKLDDYIVKDMQKFLEQNHNELFSILEFCKVLQFYTDRRWLRDEADDSDDIVSEADDSNDLVYATNIPDNNASNVTQQDESTFAIGGRDHRLDNKVFKWAVEIEDECKPEHLEVYKSQVKILLRFYKAGRIGLVGQIPDEVLYVLDMITGLAMEHAKDGKFENYVVKALQRVLDDRNDTKILEAFFTLYAYCILKDPEEDQESNNEFEETAPYNKEAAQCQQETAQRHQGAAPSSETNQNTEGLASALNCQQHTSESERLQRFTQQFHEAAESATKLMCEDSEDLSEDSEELLKDPQGSSEDSEDSSEECDGLSEGSSEDTDDLAEASEDLFKDCETLSKDPEALSFECSEECEGEFVNHHSQQEFNGSSGFSIVHDSQLCDPTQRWITRCLLKAQQTAKASQKNCEVQQEPSEGQDSATRDSESLKEEVTKKLSTLKLIMEDINGLRDEAIEIKEEVLNIVKGLSEQD